MTWLKPLRILSPSKRIAHNCAEIKIKPVGMPNSPPRRWETVERLPEEGAFAQRQ